MSAADTVTALYPQFIGDVLDAGYDDFDAALLKNGAARAITHAVSAHLYLQEGVDGLQFGSRHGDELDLWCLYEQPHDSRISAHLLKLEAFDLAPDTPQLQQTLEMLGRRWASTAQIQTSWVRHRPEETSRNRCENSPQSVSGNRPYVEQRVSGTYPRIIGGGHHVVAIHKVKLADGDTSDVVDSHRV